MTSSRFRAFTASLLLAASIAPVLAACGDEPKPVVPDDATGRIRPDAGAGATGTPTFIIDGDASPAEVPDAQPADAGLDSDSATRPDAETQGDPLFALTATLQLEKAAVGTFVPLIARRTYLDGRVADLVDDETFTLTVSGDLTAVPARLHGQLGLLTKKPGHAHVKVTDTATGAFGEDDLEVTDAKLTSIWMTASHFSPPKGTSPWVSVWAEFDDRSYQDVTPQAALTVRPENALEALPARWGSYRTLQQGSVTVSGAYEGRHADVSFRVVAPAITALAFTDAPPQMPLRTMARFTLEATRTDGSKAAVAAGITWTSSDARVLFVDGHGLATAANLGRASVTASVNGIAASTTVEVTEPIVESLRLEAADATGAPLDPIAVGHTRRLALKGVRTDQSEVDLTADASWSSTAPSILSVDDGAVKGLLTAKTLGTATIIVRHGNDAPIETTLTVGP